MCRICMQVQHGFNIQAETVGGAFYREEVHR